MKRRTVPQGLARRGPRQEREMSGAEKLVMAQARLNRWAENHAEKTGKAPVKSVFTAIEDCVERTDTFADGTTRRSGVSCGAWE